MRLPRRGWPTRRSRMENNVSTSSKQSAGRGTGAITAHGTETPERRLAVLVIVGLLLAGCRTVPKPAAPQSDIPAYEGPIIIITNISTNIAEPPSWTH